MYLALIVLPLLGSIAAGFFGRKIGVSGSQLITCACVITTTILSILAFIEVGLNKIPVKIYLFRWIDSELLNVSWSFSFDALTVSMLIPVLIVSSLVHIYSIGYMSHDPHNQRFFSYLSLFTFMMIILVTGDNYILMFVGWEGVGVCSYLLVSFWFTRTAANQSSLAAFLTNRVGDAVLTIGMFAILWSFGNIDYNTVFSLTPYYSESIVVFIGICLLIGAMAKSSQVGLHVWLPMAMEGPTPVSALIHAATMVTAGVYLLMRSSPLLEYSSTVLLLCLWVGATTTVFSSLVGLFQQDIKKVIAYSTMSQLGMMVIAIGLSSYNIALFHLINHAFYKGLLFLGAGAVIHAVADNQDFRKYGGLVYYLPLTYSVMLIASLSLVAFPFMTGFYSKDFILESAFGQYRLSSITVYFIAVIGAMFTTLYSVKVLYLTFLSNPNGPLVNYKHPEHRTALPAHEGDIFMSLPLIILAIFSIFFGYITKDIFIGLGSDFFKDNSLYIHPKNEIMLDTEFNVPVLYKLSPLFFTISLTIISILFTEFYPKSVMSFKYSRIGYNIFGFLNQRFLVESYYNKYVSGTILELGAQTTKVMDKGVVEIFGPYGLENKVTQISKQIGTLSTGIVTTYALYILTGLIFYISLIYLTGNTNHLFLHITILFGLVTNLDYQQKQYFYSMFIVYKETFSRYGAIILKIIIFTILIILIVIFPINHVYALDPDSSFIDWVKNDIIQSGGQLGGHVKTMDNLNLGPNEFRWGFIHISTNAFHEHAVSNLIPHNLDNLKHGYEQDIYNPGARCLAGLFYEMIQHSQAYLDYDNIKANPAVLNYVEDWRYRKQGLTLPMKSGDRIPFNRDFIEGIAQQKAFTEYKNALDTKEAIGKQQDTLKTVKLELLDQVAELKHKKSYWLTDKKNLQDQLQNLEQQEQVLKQQLLDMQQQLLNMQQGIMAVKDKMGNVDLNINLLNDKAISIRNQTLVADQETKQIESKLAEIGPIFAKQYHIGQGPKMQYVDFKNHLEVQRLVRLQAGVQR